MAKVLTKNDVEQILKFMNENNLKEFCVNCSPSWSGKGSKIGDYIIEGGYCSCDNDE